MMITKLPVKYILISSILGVIGIAHSLYLAIEVGNNSQQQERLRLKSVAEQTHVRLQDAVDLSIMKVQAFQAFYNVNAGKISKAEFEQYMQDINIEQSGFIQALSWLPIVTNEDKSRFEAKIKKDYPDYFIKGIGDNGKLTAIDNREIYTPVTYISPYDSNQQAHGFDVSSNPARRESMQKAYYSGKMTTTTSIRLVQESTTGFGILVIAPVSNQETGGESNDPNNQYNIIGFTNGVFKINTLMKNVLKHIDHSDISFTLKNEQGATLFGGIKEEEHSFIRFNVGIPDQSLTLEAYLNEDVYTELNDLHFDKNVLIPGVIISVLFALCIFALNISRVRTLYINDLHDKLKVNNADLEILVSKRTHELEEKNVQLSEHVELLNTQKHKLSKLMAKAKASQAIAEIRSKELEHSNQELDEFAYVASHDLKAPLHAIDQLASWINEDISNGDFDEVPENLKLMRTRVQRLESLLTDLLIYSRANKQEFNLIEVNTTELIKECFLLIAPPSNFELEVSDDLPVLVTDNTPLEQIVRNLINNAIKHHDKSMGSLKVSCVDKGQYYEFSFRDNGPGISSEFHQSIFKMFTTLNPRDEVEGSGMGLALIKKLVEYHTGTIKIESELGKGSTFTFTWPKTMSI